MLQNDVALADAVRNLAEQLQQFQSQLAEQHAINAEQQAFNSEQQATMTEQQAINSKQARQIYALTENDVKQFRQVDRLTDNFARLEVEHKVISALQDYGTQCCMSTLLKNFSVVSCFQQNC